jgi:4-amino-4-deoxy-L-arabinose transferase-like glycosyltransferase
MEWDQEKLATRGVALLVAYAAIAGVFRAAFKPLWYDEIYTLVLARQPRISAIWDALLHAVDAFPPTFYLVERAAGILLRSEHVAFRLPSILGFCGTILCVFVFVRRRSGSTCALISAAIPLLSTLYDPYAVEARGYSLAAACVALALVCYQRVNTIRWTLLMALSLAGAEAFHYYAVFALLPFALAETARFRETRRLRPGVWLALLCGVVPLTLFWPLLLSVKHYYGSDFWAQATLVRLAGVYGWFFQLPISIGVAVVVIAAIWMFAPAVFRLHDESFEGSPDVPLHEMVLVLGFLALPCVLFVVAKIIHGGFVYRYSFPALLGFPMAAGYVLPRFDRKVMVLFGTFVFCSVAVQEGLFWVPLRHQWNKNLSPAAPVEELVSAAGNLQLPVAVSGGIDFLQIAHYASPEWAKRFVCLVDPPNARLYAQTDNVDKDLLVLRSYVPLPVYEFQEFAANHPVFLLYSPGDGQWDWWPARLVNDGYSLKLLRVHANHQAKVYLVSGKNQMIVKPTNETHGTQ